MRDRSGRAVREQPDGWDLMDRVDSLEVAGEPAHRSQPSRAAASAGVPGAGCPAKRGGNGDRRGVAGIEIGDELGQLAAVVDEFVAERATQRQVVGEVGRDDAHESLPGQR